MAIAFGVPVMAPDAALSVAHAGSDPESTLHVIGASPVAATVVEYAIPTVPPGSGEVVVIVGGMVAAAIVIWKFLLLDPTELVAVTLIVVVPAVVGVPESQPPFSSVIPPGTLVAVNVIGVVPLALNWYP